MRTKRKGKRKESNTNNGDRREGEINDITKKGNTRVIKENVNTLMGE